MSQKWVKIVSRVVLEGVAVRCDGGRNLTVHFGGYEGTIPRIDAIHPAISGAERDIAILSRVGKPTCFTITGLSADGGGKPSVHRILKNAEALMFWKQGAHALR